LPVGNSRRYVFLVARPACPSGAGFLLQKKILCLKQRNLEIQQLF